MQRRILPLSEQDTPGLLQALARVPDHGTPAAGSIRCRDCSRSRSRRWFRDRAASWRPSNGPPNCRTRRGIVSVQPATRSPLPGGCLTTAPVPGTDRYRRRRPRCCGVPLAPQPGGSDRGRQASDRGRRQDTARQWADRGPGAPAGRTGPGRTDRPGADQRCSTAPQTVQRELPRRWRQLAGHRGRDDRRRGRRIHRGVHWVPADRGPLRPRRHRAAPSTRLGITVLDLVIVSAGMRRRPCWRRIPRC